MPLGSPLGSIYGHIYTKDSNVLVSKSLKNEIARRDVVGRVDDAGKMDGHQATDGIRL